MQPGDRIAVQMPNVLQYPIAACRRDACRADCGQHNPLYTAREMRHQFKDAGAALVYLNMFGKLVQDVLPDTEIDYLIEARNRRHAAERGWLINTVVKKVKKMVPDYHLPQAVAFKMRAPEGPGPCAKTGQRSVKTILLCCNTPAAPRA